MEPVERDRISVIDPIGPAIGRVKLVLFGQSGLSKWFVIGFCAWLAYLGERGVSFNFRFPYGGRGRGGSGWGEVERLFSTHPVLIVSLLVTILLISVVLAVVLLWLSSRGQFMFLYCVAENKAEISEPWHRFRKLGDSLFFFRLGVGVMFFVIAAMLGGVIAFLGATLDKGVGLRVPTIGGLISAVTVLVLIIICWLVVMKFTRDFVVALMYVGSSGCVAGWRRFWKLLAANKGKFVLYILFQIVISLVVGAIIGMVVLMTCCCAGVILIIPYIGTVAMLPILVFQRAYSLYYLKQFGREFDVFGVLSVGSDMSGAL